MHMLVVCIVQHMASLVVGPLVEEVVLNSSELDMLEAHKALGRR